MVEYQDLISFWFDEKNKPLWFNSTKEFDNELRNKFEDCLLAGKNGELKSWENNPLGLLALVILFDQIPLNIYRNTLAAFETEKKSRRVAKQCIDKNWHGSLDKEQQSFLYMPFMHSELMSDQQYALTLFEEAGLQENVKFANHHRNIIEKFGRFPHRNKVLGRESTQAELDYLSSKEAFLG